MSSSSTMLTAEEQARLQKDALADRHDSSAANLGQHHFHFLECMLKSIHPAAIRDTDATSDKVTKLVREKTKEWSDMNKRGNLFDADALKLHKKLWDCMRRDKAGLEKELSFREWCTRIQRHADNARAAAKTAQAPTNQMIQAADKIKIERDFYRLLLCDLPTNVATPE